MNVTESPSARRRKSKKPERSMGLKVLLAILADVEHHAVFSDLDDMSVGPLIVCFRLFGVRYAPGLWLGKSGAARQACSRAIRQLARQGLLERITESGRDRVRFVRPTAEGVRLAVLQAGKRCDTSALVRSLAQTEWGRTIHAAAA